jgi:serine phosphatase RsbU (regulator of sigma subunit)
MPALDQLLVVERQNHQFCTAVDVTVAPDRRSLTTRIAGHPPPILLGEPPRFLDNGHRGAPLGVRSDLGWPDQTVDVGPPWGLVAYTDGIIEPLLPDGRRLDLEGLLAIVAAIPFPPSAADLDELLDAMQQPHLAAGHDDDLAVLALLVPR